MIKVGVIGTGRWGENHVRVYSELDCDLVGLADIDSEKRILADRYGINFSTDYRQLLPLVEAVSVVVPTDRHFEVVRDCLLAGKHVLVEKPITLRAEEARELQRMARERNLTLAIGYLFRFNPAVQAVKEELKNIGDIHYVTIRYIHSNKPPRRDSGVILNFGAHVIDILTFVLGEKPQTLYCKKVNYLSAEREDCAFIVFDYGGFIAHAELSWFHPLKRRDMWIIGSKEKIYADLLEQIVEVYPFEIDYDKAFNGKELNLEIRKNEPLKQEIESFCNSVEARLRSTEDYEPLGMNPGAMDDEDYAYIPKICKECLRSAETGREIELSWRS